MSLLTPPLALSIAILFAPKLDGQDAATPHLEKRGAATQLIVDGKPFLMLAGELHNSSPSSLAYMDPIWPKLAAIPLNTVLTPVSWELVEPEDGKFDFALVDGLLAQARKEHLHIVFLWLASWKNGLSSYDPLWVKRDTKRFPRAFLTSGESSILSTFGASTREADAHAFSALMHHLREVDGSQRTVLMMQVENEVGVLGDLRDRSPAADAAFNSAVPADLVRYLGEHRNTLYSDLRDLWERNGAKTSAKWTQIFGDTPRTDEIFMAWHYARYVQSVAAAGKAEYPLPMYVNTWLAGEDSPPGVFPSGGPQPRVIDIWKAAGSALDMYSPDIYLPNFTTWCDRYHRGGNPLFIPEATGGAVAAANAFYAVGEHAAMGISPFAIDSQLDPDHELGNTYRVLEQIAPVVFEAQAHGNSRGFLLDKNNSRVDFVMNDYVLHVSLDEIFGSHSEKGFGLIVATGPDEFLGAGMGFRVSFSPRSDAKRVGIASVTEGNFEGGNWSPGRRLNGDENDQGNEWRFDPRHLSIEKAVVYRFE